VNVFGSCVFQYLSSFTDSFSKSFQHHLFLILFFLFFVALYSEIIVELAILLLSFFFHSSFFKLFTFTLFHSLAKSYLISAQPFDVFGKELRAKVD